MTNLQLHVQKAKRLGVNLTVLATSISLAACGGGGSEGFFASNNTNIGGGTTTPGTGTQVNEATGIALTLSKDQLNSKGDELTVTAKAVDKDGGGVAGKKINLNIANALTLGATSDASEKTTDEKGEVTFTVKLAGTNQSAQELLLTTTLSGTTINNVRKVTISGTSAVVQSQYEIKFDPASSLKVTGGETAVRIRAVDVNGGGVPNQAVMLAIKNFTTQSDVSIKGVSTGTTDDEGYATFTVQITKGTEASRAALIQSGVPLVATLTEQNGAVKTQVTTLGVASVAGLVTSLTLVTGNNKVNAVDGKIDVVVNAKNPEGLAVVNQNVSLVLDEQAIQYGAKLVASTIKTDANGNATFTIQTEANSLNPTGQLLVENGITTTASLQTSDGSAISSQSTKISVVSTIADEVSYLSLDTSKAIDISGGSAIVTVKAIDENGGVLKNKSVLLTVADAKKNHLSISSGSKAVTNDQGEAVFTLSYDGLLDPTNDKAAIDALLSKGVQISATYIGSTNNNISNSSVLNFKSSAVLDVERLEAKVSKGSVLAVGDSVVLTVSAINSQGKAAVNQKITLNLLEAALNNGVTLDGPTSKNTNDNGEVQYTLKVNAANKTQIANLIASDLVLGVATASGKTQTTRIEVTEPPVVENTVSSFVITPSKQTVSTLGDSVVIGVQALDSNKNGIANREVNFALSPNTSSRVSLDKGVAITNSKGFAYFTVKVSEGSIDEALLKDSITFAVNTFNNSTPLPVSQVGKINVSAPQDATNLTVSSSKATLLASGDTAEIYTKLVDQAGVAVKSYPVNLVVVDSALNGVTIEGANNAITDASGNAKFNIKLTKITDAQYQALLTNGVTVRASITLSNGVVRSQDVHLNVNEAVSQYHLDITPNKANLSANGESTVVVVSLLDSANQPVKNKKITLTARNTAGSVIINGTGTIITTQPQTVTTDELGRGFFKVEVPAIDVDKDLLLASGILLDASHTEENGATTTQIHRINVISSSSPTLPAKYSLRLGSSKPLLNVAGDAATITATLLDENGGGIADKYITLNISDFIKNGASIIGPSGVTTDNNGQAIFKVKVDETSRSQTYSALNFINDDLILSATYKEAGYSDTSQLFKVDVAQVANSSIIASIVIGHNTAEITSSTDGVYYLQNMSASVIDVNGRPVANQNVNLDIGATQYFKGTYQFGYNTPNSNIFRELIWINKGTIYSYIDSTSNTPIPVNRDDCPIAPVDNHKAINNEPVNVVTFVGNSTEKQAFTTDETGKFDFQIRYPKRFANWIQMQIGASTTVASLPNRNIYTFTLNAGKADFDYVQGTYAPNLNSPYGKYTGNCN